MGSVPLAAELLAGYDRILDVGAGEGQISRLAVRGGASAVVGVDSSRAQTDEARDALFDTSYPRAADWFERFMELAREDPGSPVALQAMLWVLRQRPEGEMHETVVAALLADHLSAAHAPGREGRRRLRPRR